MSKQEDLIECPLCGEEWDDLMDQPAVERKGFNPKGGKLYDCSVCRSRITQAQLDTGIEHVLEAVEAWEGTPTRE